ncbi:hypothetical protein [Bacillus norwichensis]|uniref:Uncharacterized protein n=1 Tax=Bacillus norwichensis TaxID=2762217 RepID=A0ABR8VJU3_9BACI|nr:hypothetical protein [Bacillus norwichensis]MBD8004972.1 hypothetical protein [Bacillus norwichensis]
MIYFIFRSIRLSFTVLLALMSAYRTFAILSDESEFGNKWFYKLKEKLVKEKNAYWYSIQRRFKPRLNEVKASGGCHRIYRAKLDKFWAQIRQGAFDKW